MITVIIGLLLLHWVGDFVCQTRWVADNKSKNWEALTLHVLIYSVILFGGLIIPNAWTLNGVSRFVVINCIMHWLTDMLTSRMTKSALERREMHTFFAIIGADQLIHTSTLIITANLLLWPIY